MKVKIMKSYPKMYGVNDNDDEHYGEDCIAFEKLDGSNLRFEFNRKQGWYKFGTRTRTFDKSDKEFGESIDLFLNKYGEPLAKTMRDKFAKTESCIAYAEYFGPVSFAGLHDPNYLHQIGYLKEIVPNPRDIVLFDFNPYKKGFVSPVDFLKLFSNLHIPNVIRVGRLTKGFVMEVREGAYPVKEGVVCKGGEGHKLWMRKIKTDAFIEEIKRVFGVGWTQFGE